MRHKFARYLPSKNYLRILLEFTTSSQLHCPTKMVRAKGYTRTTRLPSNPDVGISEHLKGHIQPPKRTEASMPTFQTMSGDVHKHVHHPPTPRPTAVQHLSTPQDACDVSHKGSRAPTRPGTPNDFLIPITYSQDGTLDRAEWELLAHIREDRGGQFSHHVTHLVNIDHIDPHGPGLYHPRPPSKPTSSYPRSSTPVPDEHHYKDSRTRSSASRHLHINPLELYPHEVHPPKQSDFDNASTLKSYNYESMVSQSYFHQQSDVSHHHRRQQVPSGQPKSQRPA
ncbi:hypothetical protein NLI96_g11090 [Meripilus lineatus]|uniref:Uncharacterized protein n=1 Tax=Meripilus lineatus TaxID=2056292 RepID=A0AAD5YDL3_9APHY|nr:hypothetical protein NLI96_g11090 [Physisporinus lineatus]